MENPDVWWARERAVARRRDAVPFNYDEAWFSTRLDLGPVFTEGELEIDRLQRQSPDGRSNITPNVFNYPARSIFKHCRGRGRRLTLFSDKAEALSNFSNLFLPTFTTTATAPSQSQHSPDHEAGTTHRHTQEMEGSTMAESASVPPSHHTQESVSLTADHHDNPSAFPPTATAMQQEPGTPSHLAAISHIQASNIRETGEEFGESHLPLTNLFGGDRDDQDEELAANILASGASHPLPADEGSVYYATYQEAVGTGGYMDDDMYGEAAVDPFVEESGSEARADMKAYAKLVLPDGDFFITSTKLKVVRDQDCYREYQREQKLAKRAQRELDRYAQEPSMPSQHGGEGENGHPSSKSSQSLVGRPVRGLPSNFSEQGGAVVYTAMSDDEMTSRRRRRRKLLSAKASSAGSIAPASLHPNMDGVYGNPDGLQEEIQILPVHPSIPADIVKISKEHLLFFYSFDEERWELQVLGARCLVNKVLFIRGQTVPLNHDDEIMVVSLTIRFKLPDQQGHSPGISRGTFGESDLETRDDDDDDGDILDTSPAARRLSHALDFDDVEDEEDEEGAEEEEIEPASRPAAGKKKPKIKLSLKKKATARKNSQGAKSTFNEKEKEKSVKLSLKQQKKADGAAEKCPDPAKKPEKGKKPKKEPAAPAIEEAQSGFPAQPAGPQTGEQNEQAEAEQKPEPKKLSPPAAPPIIEPGSIFEGVAAEEMPQKRKGPGRPPKNGLISKRDQSFVKRKIKEYEKRGEPLPPMDELVAIVRAENKAKEAAQKAAARGEPAPEVMTSIETDGQQPMGKPDIEHAEYHMMDPMGGPGATPFDPNRRPSSPGPRLIAKSPSPIKPEHEFTEEEMKKPTMTYVHILDEVLKDHPNGKADLQELYDRICKRYPYFKYKTSTSGWQSSVRHNLLQHGRFKEDGRSGKGRLWAIDYTYDLSKEKKRKLTPPPRPPPQPMQPGAYPPGMQYGQQNYQATYGQNGQPAYNGAPPPPGSSYYPAYGASQQPSYGAPPPGQHGGPMPPQARMSHHPPPNQPLQPPNSAGPSRSPAAPPPPQDAFQVVVNGIMRYRERYLAPFPPNTEAFTKHEEVFKKCTSFVSDIFHGQAASVDTEAFTEEELRVFNELSEVVARCKGGGGTPTAGTPGPTIAASSAPPASTNGNAASGTLIQSTPAQASPPVSAPAHGLSAPAVSAPGPPQVYGTVASTIQRTSSNGQPEPAQKSTEPHPVQPHAYVQTRPSAGYPVQAQAPTANMVSHPATAKHPIVLSSEDIEVLATQSPASKSLAAPMQPPAPIPTPASIQPPPVQALSQAPIVQSQPLESALSQPPPFQGPVQALVQEAHVQAPADAPALPSPAVAPPKAPSPTTLEALPPQINGTKRAADDSPQGEYDDPKRIRTE